MSIDDLGDKEHINNKKEMRFCTWCNKDVTWHTEKINHRRELLRSVFSCGFWLPFWFLMYVASKTRLCDACGNAIPEDEQ